MFFPFWYKALVAFTLLLFAGNLYVFVRSPIQSIAHGQLLSADKIITGAGTLIATFVGAWLAFRFAKSARDQTREDDEVVAGNLALFTVTSMWNQTRQHWKEVIEPYRAREDAWLNLPVSPPLNNELNFDLKSLSFLSERSPVVFQTLLLEYERFRLAAHLIEEHRRIVLEETWPRMVDAKVGIGEGRSVADIEAILGPGVVKQLRVTTGGIIKNFEENTVSLMKLFVDLRAALKAAFPHRKFIDFNFE